MVFHEEVRVKYEIEARVHKIRISVIPFRTLEHDRMNLVNHEIEARVHKIRILVHKTLKNHNLRSPIQPVSTSPQVPAVNPIGGFLPSGQRGEDIDLFGKQGEQLKQEKLLYNNPTRRIKSIYGH
jgi:hypothetical protein